MRRWIYGLSFVLLLAGCNTAALLALPSRAVCSNLSDELYTQLYQVFQARRLQGQSKADLLAEVPSECNDTGLFPSNAACETCVKAMIDDVYGP
jgi:hypothetical protein